MYQPARLWPRELCFSGRQPCDEAYEHHSADSSTGVVHGLTVNRFESRKIKQDTCESQEEEAGYIKGQAVSSKRIRAFKPSVLTHQAGEDPSNEGHCI